MARAKDEKFHMRSLDLINVEVVKIILLFIETNKNPEASTARQFKSGIRKVLRQFHLVSSLHFGPSYREGDGRPGYQCRRKVPDHLQMGKTTDGPYSGFESTSSSRFESMRDVSPHLLSGSDRQPLYRQQDAF